MSEKQRLDAELVRRGLAPSRAQARAAIEAGKVTVGGQVEAKPGRLVESDSVIEAELAHPWVSRGGVKLAYALDAFGVDPAGRVCLDVGASTGGFTDVLLARGAKTVAAVDVGRGQLHPKLRADPRVRSLEETDARSLTLAMIGERPQLIVCDASFIGLAKVLATALDFVRSGSRLVALVKPQFEAERGEVGKGGVVRDPAVHQRVCAAARAWVEGRGWRVEEIVPSPITGPEGNVEFLLGAVRLAPPAGAA